VLFSNLCSQTRNYSECLNDHPTRCWTSLRQHIHLYNVSPRDIHLAVDKPRCRRHVNDQDRDQDQASTNTPTWRRPRRRSIHSRATTTTKTRHFPLALSHQAIRKGHKTEPLWCKLSHRTQQTTLDRLRIHVKHPHIRAETYPLGGIVRRIFTKVREPLSTYITRTDQSRPRASHRNETRRVRFYQKQSCI